MSEKVLGVNPEIIKWARNRSGFTLQDIAKGLNKGVSVIRSWESGVSTPTYIQLEAFADKCKRPVAIFFLPDPPEEDDATESLALRSTEIEKLTPNTRYLLRQAQAIQLSLVELNNGVNPAERKIFRDIQGPGGDDPTELAQQVRDYLGISVKMQVSWNSTKKAVENWRDCVQENGVFVFKNSFKQKEIDGFCLVDDEFPIIYLNNSTSPTRQIFS
ncbi:helix-turn-helix domain-containing protein, partial [Candidatus Poribacteria bacterium]|nr:helix-turn-helix domain-containing protein [Candidatus Poribacteria bacterium]